MKGGKEEISYYDLGGREAEMYRAIDEFLALRRGSALRLLSAKRLSAVQCGRYWHW